MRKQVVLLLPGCGLVFNGVVLAALYGPGASYAQAALAVAFLVAFLTFGSALLLLNGGRLGRMKQELLWGALGVLPRWVQVGLGLLLVATVAQVLASQTGEQSELGFDRMFAAITVWLAAVGTALHYSAQLGREPEPGRRGYRIAQAIFAAIGVALAVAAPGRDETAARATAGRISDDQRLRNEVCWSAFDC